MALRRCLHTSLGSGLLRPRELLEAASLQRGITNGLALRNLSSEIGNRRYSTTDVKSSDKLVLYRAKWMRPLRVMVRLKIFQLGGLAAFALPLAEYANEDNKYELSAIIPPLKGWSNSELETAANQVLIPLDVVGERQFFLSLRHGRLIEKEVLVALLLGKLDLEDLPNLVRNRQAV